MVILIGNRKSFGKINIFYFDVLKTLRKQELERNCQLDKNNDDEDDDDESLPIRSEREGKRYQKGQ